MSELGADTMRGVPWPSNGLSEIPFMEDMRHWGILTIGTGLGNARFSRRTPRS